MEFEKIQNVIAETLGCDVDSVVMDAKLADDLGADSLAAVELIMALEEATGITIDDADAETFKTVADIVDYLKSHQD